MSLDNTLWLAGILTEAVVVGLLLHRRVWRLLPFFCIFCAWDFLTNAGAFTSDHFLKSSFKFFGSYKFYLIEYLVETLIDSVLEFCVLVELAWSVLRPIRSSLPRFALVFVTAGLLALGAIVWQFPSPTDVSNTYGQHFLMHLAQCVSILRILFFLILAGCSQLLSIGWRDRELQVATGLGLYSLSSLAVTMLQSHHTNIDQYSHLNQFVIASFLCCLLYWVFSFVQKEAARREFTPQMQNLLLAVAGVARAERAALTEAAKSGQRKIDQ